uniref:Thymidylate synthase (FAD) n=1 Tax=Strigamia maritima TaxID=126957 RepID=T1III3_STRMM
MCEIKFHIKLPIFVARQWIRHRTASVNEHSARYSILGHKFYLPERNNLAAQCITNKQGRCEQDPVPSEVADKCLMILENDAKMCYQHYLEMMNQDENGIVNDQNIIGIARELARINLTLNFYTEWYWKIDLHNLLHFIRLRTDSHAQYEIRMYAEKILNIVKLWVPLVYDTFNKFKVESVNISKKGQSVIRKLIAREDR